MKEKMERRIALIKNFAKEMGYYDREISYAHCENGRPCYAIELEGTTDSKGDPFVWAWYTDTYEEF